MTKKKRRLILAAGLLLLALALALLLSVSQVYRAGDRALQALTSDTVQVERTDYGWFFDGPGEDTALIFYPGGRVEETAYAPLLHSLAHQGLDVCLVKMPLRLAVFGMNAADGVIARYDYAHWLIGGHSLGGAVAAIYAASHELDGVILLAAYPTRSVDEPVLLLCGSEDGVIDREKLAASGQFGAVEEQVIAGANHAQFGDYGAQRGDGLAAISAEKQQSLACAAIAVWREENIA